MANLVSPGVSVTVTDESMFIPAAASTVPLFFIATADEKTRIDGVTPAAGTYEYDTVRTITSVKQSLDLFGVPRFIEDSAGNQHHGDARNEYGLFAINQFLGVGNLAYVVRANVNLNDNITDVRNMWDRKVQESSYILENLINAYMNEHNATNGYYPSTPGTAGFQTVDFGGVLVGTNAAGIAADGTYTISVTVDGGVTQTVSVALTTAATVNDVIAALNVATADASVTLVNGNLRFTSHTTGETSTIAVADGATNPLFVQLGTATIIPAVPGTPSPYKQTVTSSELISMAEESMAHVFASFSFRNTHDTFMDDVTVDPLLVFANGYSQPSTADYLGFDGFVADWANGGFGSVVPAEFTAQEAANMLISVADDYKFTREFRTYTSLGANDSARRVAITTALQATVNMNQEIRSENYEYNLILCPGYPEIADEMLALVADINDEALVIGDTPMDKDPEQLVAWAGTTDRQSSTHIAYYYPHSLASNIDGKNVLVSSSGTALRTITYSDNVSQLFFAPAGTRRGLVTGVSNVGYVSGQLGGPARFEETHLNLGQRNDMYKYFTNINPIVFIPGRGIIVMGQKTSAPDASALDRINVSRLIKYIKRQLRKNTLSFVFEPNDQLTRDNIKAVVENFLGDLVVKRGLYDFAVLCDESNNTPDRIDRNELYVDIALKPTKAAEFVYIPIRVVATGADI